jgi:ribosome-associated protein
MSDRPDHFDTADQRDSLAKRDAHTQRPAPIKRDLPDQSVPLIPEEPGGVELAPGVRIRSAGMRLQYSRGGGPGGQNVNKVNTRAEIWIDLPHIIGMTDAAKHRLRGLAGRRITAADELHIISETHRSQDANRAEVFQRIRDLILEAQVIPKKRRKTKPSKAAKRRRLESKRHRSEIKSNRRSSGE